MDGINTSYVFFERFAIVVIPLQMDGINTWKEKNPSYQQVVIPLQMDGINTTELPLSWHISGCNPPTNGWY